MEFGEWLSQNWFNIFTSVGIMGSFWIGIVALRSETKTRRVTNLLTITSNHHEVWREFFHSPELARVIDPLADVAKQPVTPTEKFFVQMVLSNTSSMYEMLKDELVTKQEGLRLDIKSFFSLPVPKAVWNKSKLLQNQDFAAFVESALKN